MRTAILCLLAACGSDAGTGGPDAQVIDPTDGPAQFAANCASCHGEDGSGTELAPTILNPVKPYATYVVRHGRNEMGFPSGGMTAFDAAALSDVQLGAILDFLATAPKPTDGAGLYARLCTNCHGSDGRSGRVAKNIVREVGEIAEKIRFGHGGTSYGARTEYMPAWKASEISDAEIALLRTYVSGL